jgi:high affinity Mn2+ porin
VTGRRINQLRATTTTNRIVITAGKMGVGDIFDTNKFAHDPRGDFLNWSLVDTGSFDYAANAWGYTYGVAGEWYQGPWTLRAGFYNLSKVPNGVELESNFRQNALIVEGERRFHIGGREGAVRVTGFRNRGLFARFDEALACRAGRCRARSGPGAPQAGSPWHRAQRRAGGDRHAGRFLRAGASNGAIETYDFTDIDRTLALGGALKGKGWGRAQDNIGLAMVVNAISPAHQRWLAAGGLGVLVGDGACPIRAMNRSSRPITPGGLSSGGSVLRLSAYRQPGYNRDRGPANVFGLRVHAGF